MTSKKIPHIQVDAFPLVDDHYSGVGHYTLGIVRGFDEMAGEGKLTYSLIVPKHWTDRLKKYEFEHYKRIIKNPIPNRYVLGLMKYHWKFPMDLLNGRGIYYFPSFLAWPMWREKSSVVVHDVTYLAVPECVHKGNRDFLEAAVPFSLSNAQNIVAVSEFSKAEIIKYYGYDPESVYVAHPSIERRHFYKRSPEEIHRVKAKYDIFSDKYILSVGNIEPRKNYDRLIEAYTSLPRKITDEYPLVIVGAGGWNNENVKEMIQKAKEDGYRIINPKQFVEDDDMPALFSGAQFFVFTPIYEGFGMPPLEAMACGTPVLASRVASLPEAAGDAATYTDPFDVKDIRDKLEEMVKKTEKDRGQFDEAMKRHLESFSWRESAEITASALTGLPLEYFREGKR
jgi:glycosyltransferase involved in cell wall biosynthesis